MRYAKISILNTETDIGLVNEKNIKYVKLKQGSIVKINNKLYKVSEGDCKKDCDVVNSNGECKLYISSRDSAKIKFHCWHSLMGHSCLKEMKVKEGL